MSPSLRPCQILIHSALSSGRNAGMTRRMEKVFQNGRRPRLQDVARQAGVSLATASRVLTSGRAVGPVLRERVQAAAANLGYLPHGAARALSTRHSRTIAAVVPSLANAGFAIAVEALQHVVDKAGYTLLLASSGYDPDAERREVLELLARGIDGIVLVGAQHAAPTVAALDAAGVPVVCTWTLMPDAPCVGFDNRAAAATLTRYLLDLGHREFGVIAGRIADNDRAAARVEGVRAALATAGLTLRAERLIERPYRIEEGRIAMRALLGARPRPTAVICGNDQLAFGALIEASAQGRQVPRDVSVAGFNDLDFAAFLSPPLTTVQVPAGEIGQRAGELLLDLMAGRVTPAVNEVAVRLVVRDSTAPPPLASQTWS
ncbi:LacI family DNA-binding transcriptional regulator [Falsiroseomonas sp. HW251]|uniref:LacI family DNA-binding transcriptional regulator n=1 Tax=Falsiroseomonas sp. HW251 TaxID=3390998 RepID=UPI003D315C29